MLDHNHTHSPVSYHDFSLFGALPQCPEVLVKYLPYPSLVFTFFITAIASMIFMFVVACKYNSVRVFDHKIRTPNISNTLWILFYFCIFAGSVLNCVRFAIVSPLYVNMALEGVSLSLHGLSTLALCASLNHQRRFRSTTGYEAEELVTDPLLRRYDKLKKTVSLADALFVLLAVLYLVFAWLAVYGILTKWAFLGAFLLQRIPVLFLTALVIFARTSRHAANLHAASSGTVTEPAYSATEGPSRNAKILLGLATIFSVSGDVPLSLWAEAFGTSCVFWIGGGVDLVHVLYVLGLVLYFAFLRSEYLRNMEECIWHTVQRFQRSFDFRGDFNFRKF